MLQAEILVQYGMRSKAIERLQRIQELFRGERTQPGLATVVPRGGNESAARGVCATFSAPPSKSRSERACAVRACAGTAAAESADVNSFTKGRRNHPQTVSPTNADAVMSTAVNEIGAQLEAEPLCGSHAQTWNGASAIKEFPVKASARGSQSPEIGWLRLYRKS